MTIFKTHLFIKDDAAIYDSSPLCMVLNNAQQSILQSDKQACSFSGTPYTAIHAIWYSLILCGIVISAKFL